MAKRKHGYSWPARSRRAMIAYLADHETYWPMNSNNGGCVLAWNVKIYHADDSGEGRRWAQYQNMTAEARRKEFPTRADLDEKWSAHVEASPDFFWRICEDCARMYHDEEWTNYPGIEQGEWKFSQNGRSGGYLILTDAPSWLPAPRGWACCRMTWDSKADYQDWVNSLTTPTLKQFYRAIRVLDHDLRREAVEAEFSYQVAFQRQQWEEEQDAEEQADARGQEEARPDLYPS